jgi:hypothetical protein
MMRLAPIAMIATILFILPIAGAQFSGSPFDPKTYDTSLCTLTVDSSIKPISRSGTAIFNISITDKNWAPPGPWDYASSGHGFQIKAEMSPEGTAVGYVAAMTALSVNNMWQNDTKYVELIVVAPSAPEAYKPITTRIVVYGYDWQQAYYELVSINVVVIPEKFTELELRTEPILNVLPGRYINLPVTLTNYGNYRTHINVDVSIDKEWQIVLPPTPMLVEANTTVTLPVGVYVPERLGINENAHLRIGAYDTEKPNDKKTNTVILSANGHYLPIIDSSFSPAFSIPGFEVLFLSLALAGGVGAKYARNRRN